MTDFRGDDDVRAVVVTGAGDKAFCAGADLTGMAAGAGQLALHESRGDLADLFRAIWQLGKPTIAKVRGYALAGGMGLALACDLVVAVGRRAVRHARDRRRALALRHHGSAGAVDAAEAARSN